MAHELSKCPCGGEAVLVAPGPRRVAVRAAAVEAAGRAEIARQAAKGRDERRAATKAVARAMELVRVLGTEVAEVECGKCRSHVAGESIEVVVNRWNRAVAKLSTLAACCRDAANHDVRDVLGAVLVRCRACKLRHFPLSAAS